MIRRGSFVIKFAFSSLVATRLAFLCSSRWTPSGIVRFKFRFECYLTLFWIPTTSSSILMCWNRAWEFFACCGFLRRLCRCRSFSRLWWFRSMQSSPMSANPSISANWFAAWFSRTCHFGVDEKFNSFHLTRASSSLFVNFIFTLFDTPPRSVFIQAKISSNSTSILPKAWHTSSTSSSEIIGSASIDHGNFSHPKRYA